MVSAARANGHRLLLVTFSVFLVALSAASGWLIADSFRLALHMPAQLNYLDGFIVDDANRVAAGEPLYEDPSVAPYAVNMYTPGSIYAMAGLIRLGVDGFVAGRLLSFISLVGVCVLIGLVGWPRTGWLAVAAALVLAVHPIQWPWSLMVRPDLPALLLSVLGVTLVIVDERRWWPVAALFLAAALMTKQSSIAAPVAVGAYLIVKDWRRGLGFGATFALAVTAAAAVLQWSSDGQFLFHVAVANDHPFSWGRAWFMYRRFVVTGPFATLLLLGLVGAAIHRRRWSLPAVYAVTTAGVAVAAGRLGASMNHFVEPVTAVALLAACELPREWFRGRSSARSVAALLLLGGIAMSSASSWLDRLRAHRVARSMVPVHERLVDTIRSVPGPVVSDDAAAVVGAGKRVHIRPFIMSQLAAAGRWDQEPFLEELRKHHVGMVVIRTVPRSLYESRYTPEMRAEIAANYRVAFTYLLGAPFAVMVPDTAPDPPAR